MPGRTQYIETITSVDEDGVMLALTGVNVTLYQRDTNILKPMYREGDTTVTTTYSTPYVTENGLVDFWADAGAYDIAFEDTASPKRIEDKRIGWDAVPGAANSLPGSILEDGTTPSDKLISVLMAQLASEVKRSVLQIGQLIEWWCPSGVDPATQYPPGCVPCEGQTLLAGAHDFPVAGSVVLPDYRGKGVMGADRTKARGTASTLADGASGAPGVAGVGGSNTGKNLQHGHTSYSPVPFASNGGAGNLIGLIHRDASWWGDTSYSIYAAGSAGGPVHAFSRLGGSRGDAGSAAANDGSIYDNNQRSDVDSGYEAAKATSTALSSSADMRPAHHGALILMKVKYD